MSVKGYLLSVFSLVVLTEISRLLLPNGKTKRTAEIIFSVIIVITLFSPVIKLKDVSISNLDNIIFNVDESFLYRANSESERLYKIEAESYLKSEGIFFDRVEIKCEKSRIKKVTVYLSETVIDEKSEHINSSEVIKKLSSLLNIGQEAIEIVE